MSTQPAARNRRLAALAELWTRHGAGTAPDPVAPDPAAPDPAAPEIRPNQPGAKQQRRGYAAAVLRTLARTHWGRPASQIHATLRSTLAPPGMRLTPATLRELAADIAASRPFELP